MILPDDPMTPVDDLLFDRLVDGDLDPEQRRELLTRLDAEPDGWRRCALAFLEAQCWRESLGGFAQAVAVDPPKAAKARPSRQASILRLAPSLAMAACLLLAFALGWAAGGVRRLERRGDGPIVASHQNHNPTPKTPEIVGPEGRTRAAVASPSVAPEKPPTALAESSPSRDRDEQRVESNVVPDYIRGQLERQGYQIERRPGLVAVGTMKDGRRVAIPVDGVKVRYVGRQTF